MANPWTLEGPETIIARPTRALQQHGKRPIVEGPEFLLGPKGDLFITFSGSACWSDDYAIGLLHAAPGSDPLDAAAWRQIDGPVLAKSVANSVYAPGHNGFFTSPDGRERSEEHTSELQSIMRISYAVFCLKKKKQQFYHHIDIQN